MIGNAVRVMRIATNAEANDGSDEDNDLAAKAFVAKGGEEARNMTPERRSEIARKAVESRWRKSLE